MNPYAFAATQGLGELGKYFGEAPQRKLMGQQMGRQTDLYELLRWHSGLGNQQGISQGNRDFMMGQFNTSMQPMLNTLGGRAAKYGSGMDVQRMLAGQMIAPTARFSGNLMNQSLNMGQQNNQLLMSLLARLAGA